jgi:hypothetical protein
MTLRQKSWLAVLLSAIVPTISWAEPVRVTVTIENVAPTNSVSFAPLRVGFHNGTYDAFNNGQTATAPIVSIAEGGSGSAWFPAFQAADPTAVLGSVGGALLPGATASNSFIVDSTINPFFTFASMVIPSNDLFLGNDSPTAFRLFDTSGNLALTTIRQFGRSIWNAGSETADPNNAAFLVGGNNDLRTPENGVVEFSFSELNTYNGLLTRGGYTFNRQITNDSEIFRISFQAQAVPAPPAVLLAGIGFALAGLMKYRRAKASIVAVS